MPEDNYRIESDALGSMNVPTDALYGIHALRAIQNFPDKTPFHAEWYQAMGKVKLACYLTYRKFKKEALLKYTEESLPLHFICDEVLEALISVSTKTSKGQWFNQFIVPAIQGGAGTSINMNVNEIIANAALLELGDKPGNYQRIDPIEQANVFQSTNDVVPTALRIAVMKLLLQLETDINKHRSMVENTERQCRNVLRQAYTQMQEAVPSSYDKLISTYNNALSRDWWRVSKCHERIKEVNLGGGAIGTALSIPRYHVMHVVGELQKLTNLPITRSENLTDATANLDSFVEVHATLKAHAVNLEKMSSDLRLLGADLFRNREIHLPKKQVGSSIMPGKVNPVITEYVVSSVHRVYANDMLISNLCGQGCLDLNAYLPSIGHAIIESLKLLINANKALVEGLWTGLQIPSENDPLGPLFFSPSITTALSPHIGYHKAAELAKVMQLKKCSIYLANKDLGLIDENLLVDLLQPDNLLKLGFSLSEINAGKQSRRD
jgi:aspartate ammonia-lyase